MGSKKELATARSKKELAIALSNLEQLKDHKLEFEQYQTPGEIAADALWTAKRDIEGSRVVDLGCGNGILGIGAALLGADHVTCVEADQDAIRTAISNSFYLHLPIEFVLADARMVAGREFDTCVMNPPFGIQSSNRDRDFLHIAFLTSETVYSFHKAGSGEFLDSFAGEHGFESRLLKRYDFRLKHTQDFHTKRVHTFEAGLWRFSRR